MENVTPARRGRPRKAAPVPNNAGEGENASHVNIRDGETGGTRSEAQAEPLRPSEGVDFGKFVEFIKKINSHSYRVSCVYHPEGGEVIQTDNLGNIRSEKGELGYQLNTGEIIRI